jgi:hypothetical protein
LIVNDREAQVDPLVELDGQQLALLDVLRRSGDWSASFSELRDAGIEFPASIVEELELIGLPLERRAVRRGALSSPGVRLRPVTVATPLPYAPPPDVTDRLEAPPPSAPAARIRVPPLADLRSVGARSVVLVVAAVLALVVALAASAPSDRRSASGRRHPSRAVANRAATAVHALAAPRPRAAPRKRAVARPSPVRPTPPERPGGALASELQASGHALLESGHGGTAAARLSEALKATGERVSDCVEPASEACLTYAYALYDLGRALALEGRPAQAASVLEQRLRIDNQREVVATALEHVHAATGAPSPQRSAGRAHTGTGPSGPSRAGGVQAPA